VVLYYYVQLGGEPMTVRETGARPFPPDQPVEIRQGFHDAAALFVDSVSRVPVDAWDRPGLGEWTIRALVGHTSRALVTVETYLEAGADTVAIVGPADYFLSALASPTAAAAVAERGRQAGAALGDDPADAMRVLQARVVARLATAPDDALVGTPFGGMTLLDYLPTRIVELTIHTLDLAAALGEVVTLPENASAITVGVIADLARRRGLTGPFLLAATGRRSLPEGFSVL